MHAPIMSKVGVHYLEHFGPDTNRHLKGLEVGFEEKASVQVGGFDTTYISTAYLSVSNGEENLSQQDERAGGQPIQITLVGHEQGFSKMPSAVGQNENEEGRRGRNPKKTNTPLIITPRSNVHTLGQPAHDKCTTLE